MRRLKKGNSAGRDCKSIPIEWKIKEQKCKKGKNKEEKTINEFREECRKFDTG